MAEEAYFSASSTCGVVRWTIPKELIRVHHTGMSGRMLQALTVCTLLATAGMFAQVSWAAGAVDVSSHVKVTQSGFLMNRQTGIWTTTLTVTNTTGSSITGPIQVAVTN